MISDNKEQDKKFELNGGCDTLLSVQNISILSHLQRIYY